MDERVSKLEQRVTAVETNQKQHHNEIEKNRTQLSTLEKSSLTNHLHHKRLDEHQEAMEHTLDVIKSTLNVMQKQNWKLYTAIVVIVALVPSLREAVLPLIGL